MAESGAAASVRGPARRRTREEASLDNGDFAVLLETPEVVVIDKPHDVAMDGERASPDELTVERWVHRYLTEYLAEPLPEGASIAQGGGKPLDRQKRLKFVHQLDYATSGVLVLAFSRDVAAALAHCFEFRQTRKEYVALVHGWVDKSQLDVPHKRTATAAADESESVQGQPLTSTVRCSFRVWEKQVHLAAHEGSHGAVALAWPVAHDKTDPEGFRMKAVTAPDGDGEGAGLEALTVLSVLGWGTTMLKGPDGVTTEVPCTHVHLRLYTGRRHQLRVHCYALGHPIVGDAAYDGPRWAGYKAPRMMLHAKRIWIGLDLATLSTLSPKERQLEKRSRRRETIGSAPMADDAALSGTVVDASDRLLEYFAPRSVTP
jgi:23S rRNA-/tRNA-specific pseudouridylate synthase